MTVISMTVGFIGAGNMATAILRGALRQNVVAGQQVYLSNRHIEKTLPFQPDGVHTTTDNRLVAEKADLLVLAVKPQMFADVMAEIADLVAGTCVVSIAAGISSATMQAALPGAYIVRSMPNTALMVGLGATALAPEPNVPAHFFDAAEQLFSAAGEVALIPESQMNDIINVHGSSTAWMFRMAEAMIARATAVGIDPQVATRFTAMAFEGAGRLMAETGEPPAELRRQVCSPGGATLAGLSAMDDMNFEAMMDEVMVRTANRAAELGN